MRLARSAGSSATCQKGLTLGLVSTDPRVAIELRVKVGAAVRQGEAPNCRARPNMGNPWVAADSPSNPTLMSTTSQP